MVQLPQARVHDDPAGDYHDQPRLGLVRHEKLYNLQIIMVLDRNPAKAEWQFRSEGHLPEWKAAYRPPQCAVETMQGSVRPHKSVVFPPSIGPASPKR